MFRSAAALAIGVVAIGRVQIRVADICRMHIDSLGLGQLQVERLVI